MPRIWTLSELAAEIGCTRQTLWKRVLGGHVPAPRYVSQRGTPFWSQSQAARIVMSWVPDLRRR